MKFVSWISKEMFPFRAKCFTVEIFSSIGWRVHFWFSFENRISFTFFYFSLHKIIADTMIGQICHTNKVSDTVYCLERVQLRNSQNMKLLSIKMLSLFLSRSRLRTCSPMAEPLLVSPIICKSPEVSLQWSPGHQHHLAQLPRTCTPDCSFHHSLLVVTMVFLL